MPIVGLGVDIVEISRFDAYSEEKRDTLAKRILSESELAIYTNSTFPIPYLAKRFAVKEAAAKALGTGIAQGVTFQHFVTDKNEKTGKPNLRLQGRAKQIADSFGVSKLWVSISDEKHYAVATVILESD